MTGRNSGADRVGGGSVSYWVFFAQASLVLGIAGTEAGSPGVIRKLLLLRFADHASKGQPCTAFRRSEAERTARLGGAFDLLRHPTGSAGTPSQTS